MATLFIDANLYLDLYRITDGKKLLASILLQQRHILITKQVVAEVQRNKVKEAAKFLGKRFVDLDTLVFQTILVLLQTWSNYGRTLGARWDEVNKLLSTIAVAPTLERISKSEDDVSKALEPLFAKAVAETPEELALARDRKERGNPPGKNNDSLGDQITWEQLLGRAKENSPVWILSKDKDYHTSYGGQLYLNAFLRQELLALRPAVEVFCFDKLAEGIRHFGLKMGVALAALPTDEESQNISEELNAQMVPPAGWDSVPFGWLPQYSNTVLLMERLRNFKPTAAAQTSGSGWHSGMGPDRQSDDKPK